MGGGCGVKITKNDWLLFVVGAKKGRRWDVMDGWDDGMCHVTIKFYVVAVPASTRSNLMTWQFHAAVVVVGSSDVEL